MARSSRRKSTPLSPAKLREEATPIHQTRKTTRARAREPSVTAVTNDRQVKEGLGAVEEEADAVSVHGPQSVRTNKSSYATPTGEQDFQRLESRRVPSIRASVCDDIAPSELHVESMIKHLTELNFRADEILSQIDLLSTQQLLDRFSDRRSPAWEDFSEDAARLERERQYYCVDTDFLQIDALSQQLAAGGLPTIGASRIHMKANLALFLYRLVEAHPVELHNLLITLSSIQPFPEAFSTIILSETEDQVSYDDDFRDDTILLGLGILTQCFIFRAKRNAEDSTFDRAKVLKEVFFADEEDTARDLSLGHTSLAEQDGYHNLAQKIASEIVRITSKKNSLSVDIRTLEKKYPWTKVVAKALSWIKARAVQINHDIERAGGVRAIKHRLERYSVKGSLTASRRKSRPLRADEEFAGKISFLKNVDDNLNAGDADSQQGEVEEDDEQRETDEAGRGVQEKTPVEVEARPRSGRILREIIPESPQAHDRLQDTAQDQDQYQTNLINDDEPVEQEIPDSAQPIPATSAIKPTRETATVLRVLQRQAKEGNKENSPPAQSAHPSTRQTTTPRANAATPAQARSSSKGKRRRRDSDHEDLEDDDDDDFESDNRQTKRPRPRPQASSQPRRQPPPSTQPLPSRTHTLSASASIPPSSTAPPPSSYQAYTHAQRHAKSNVSLSTSLLPPKPPQTRRPWTPPEIERLMHLMRLYGCAWSTIKKADERMVDPQLTERSQVQLKDKARNMKLDFLKAEVPLPGELSGVTISKGHKEMLRGMNIAYPGEEMEE